MADLLHGWGRPVVVYARIARSAGKYVVEVRNTAGVVLLTQDFDELRDALRLESGFGPTLWAFLDGKL